MGRKSYVDGRFGQIHVEEMGQGPTLILHHQAPSDSSQFRRGAPLLAEAGIHVVLVDTPGFGGSDAPPSPPTIEDLSETTNAVIEGLNLTDVVVLGHHTGSMIASEAVVRYPENIRAVILNGPFPLTADEVVGWTENVLKVEQAWHIKEDGSHYQDVWNMIAGFLGTIKDYESLHWMVTSAMRSGADYWYGHNACFSYDQAPSLKALEQSGLPVLILTNEGDVAKNLADRTREMCPGFQYICLPGGTFEFANEYPDVWAKAVVDFVKSLG